MKKKICIKAILLSTLFVSFLYSQENGNLIKNFVSSNIDEKILLIKNIPANTEESTEFCIIALEFINAHYNLLSEDSNFIQLARAVVQYSSATTENTVLLLMQDLFALTGNEDLQIELLRIFSSTSMDNQSIVDLINTYTTNLFASDDAQKNTKLLLMVDILANFGSISSFPILFDCYAYSNNQELSMAASLALNALANTYEDEVYKLITKGTSHEKLYTLNLVIKNDKNSDFFKAEVAEKSLSNATYTIENVSNIDSNTIALQMAAINELMRISWTRSATLIKDFFILAKQEYKAGLLNDDQFVQIIFAFSQLSAIEAATHLSAYLVELNQAQTENIPYSKPIVLAVIQSLGLLGNKIAFDSLFYATYLEYPEDIILAARDALAALKW